MKAMAGGGWLDNASDLVQRCSAYAVAAKGASSMWRTIRWKMIALIALPTLAIYIVVLGLTMRHLRSDSRAEVKRDMTRLADNYAARFDYAFREAAAIAITTARAMEVRPDASEEQIYAQLRANVLQNPAVYGAAMAFEPGTYRTGDELYSPYVYRGADGTKQMNITREVYDWYGEQRWQWWQIPKRTGRGAWTDPYFDKGAGNVLMVTYSAPFFRHGELRGVTTVDIMLPTLRKRIGGNIVDIGDFVILTRDGYYVVNPDPTAIMSRTVFDDAEKQHRPDLAAVGKKLVSGEAGVSVVDGWNGEDRQWVFYAPIRSTQWVFAARVSEAEALADVQQRMAVASVAMAGTLAAIIGCIWFVSGRITRPIAKLRSKVHQIAGGELDARVEGITSRDEIGELAADFNKMTGELHSVIDRLSQERADREKMERDLDLAREIQQGLLPTGELNVPGFEIAGWNLAAEKTGGDYFDWFPMPNGRIQITLADVTGHGIAPALIVTACRAYMRAASGTGEVDLGWMIGHVNDLLYAETPSDRFITAAVGVLDPTTSRMSLISAGQGPILYYEAATDTVHNWNADALPLAVAEGIDFAASREIEFKSGDMLILATDGFFEWANPDDEQFGTDRLMAFAENNHTLAPRDFIAALHEAVVAHARGTHQADDLTAVVIRRV